ncbi:MAG: hypothetical protein LIO86_15360 [Lachnospiraceae bacterium]|nr:hypothetical protein [Lachnospiraceae bacterium]
MIVSVETLASLSEFADTDEDMLKRKLLAVESLIRSYTNNNFQNRHIRFEGYSEGSQVFGTSPYLKAGDTVQITKSDVNDGLYVLTAVDEESVTVDGELFTVPLNRVTKVEYPAVIQEGVINLLMWEVENRQNVGVKQETLSRHSVTYYDQDSNNTVMGYPVALLGFLRPFMKARF